MTNWDRVSRTNYRSKAFWDVHWIMKARDLLESAKLIEPEVVRYWDNSREVLKTKSGQFLPDYYLGTYFMLIAYAVENIFKAVIVRNNSVDYKEKFKQTPKFPKELQSHSLVELAKQAGYSFNLYEEDLLRRLTRSAIWYGRYPVPLDYKFSSNTEIFSDGKKRSVGWFGANDIPRLKKFIDDLKVSLNISGE